MISFEHTVKDNLYFLEVRIKEVVHATCLKDTCHSQCLIELLLLLPMLL